MEASKITFTDDFKKKASKKLNTIRKGELMWERLEKADKVGELQLCARKVDVGRVAGIADDKKARAWASNMVRRGAITETFRSFQDGKPLYEYHLGKKPNYSYNGGRKKAKDEKKTESYYELKQRMEVPVEKPVEKPEVKVETQMNLTAPNDITITIGNITIKVENVEADYLASLIKTLTK